LTASLLQEHLDREFKEVLGSGLGGGAPMGRHREDSILGIWSKQSRPFTAAQDPQIAESEVDDALNESFMKFQLFSSVHEARQFIQGTRGYSLSLLDEEVILYSRMSRALLVKATTPSSSETCHVIFLHGRYDHIHPMGCQMLAAVCQHNDLT
jgi:hypothetical protein